MINIVVPPSQIIDTVELFHFKRQRKLGLKFLSKYLLKEDIQSKTHDSIEDARTALKLYEKYEEMQMYGDFDEQLLEIYRFGKMFGFKEVDEATTAAADENTAGTGKKNMTATTKGVRDDKSVNDELIQSTSMLSFGANEFLPPSPPPPHLSSQNVHHSSAAAVAAAAQRQRLCECDGASATAAQQQQNVLTFQPPPPPHSFATSTSTSIVCTTTYAKHGTSSWSESKVCWAASSRSSRNITTTYHHLRPDRVFLRRSLRRNRHHFLRDVCNTDLHL